MKTYKVEPLSDTVRRSPCVDGLNLASIDLAHNRPRCAVRQAEYKDSHDDDPASSAFGVDNTRSIETANQEHCS